MVQKVQSSFSGTTLDTRNQVLKKLRAVGAPKGAIKTFQQSNCGQDALRVWMRKELARMITSESEVASWEQGQDLSTTCDAAKKPCWQKHPGLCARDGKFDDSISFAKFWECRVRQQDASERYREWVVFSSNGVFTLLALRSGTLRTGGCVLVWFALELADASLTQVDTVALPADKTAGLIFYKMRSGRGEHGRGRRGRGRGAAAPAIQRELPVDMRMLYRICAG